MQTRTARDKTSTRSNWPIADLEVLGRCPVCGEAGRDLAYADLSDLAFGAAPGLWTLWRCRACAAAYLDPRPSAGSIGRAYGNYYTHDAVAAARERSGAKFRAVRGFHRLGALAGPAIDRVGPLRRARRRIAHRFRHLPLAGGRLLDIGCGSGDFLALGKALGYDVVGIDFDGSAVATARGRGLDAHEAGMPESGLAGADFDHVTLDNVLEHLHDPKAALNEAMRLLRPGGRVWLSQPNLNAIGLAHFGSCWRGLEPPRHLCLWGPGGLAALLADCGFVNLTLLPPSPAAAFSYFARSQIQREGGRPDGGAPLDGVERRWGAATEQAYQAARRAADRDWANAETVTVCAYRPAT